MSKDVKCIVTGCELDGIPGKRGCCAVHYNDLKHILDAQIVIIENTEKRNDRIADIWKNKKNEIKYLILYCLYMYDVVSIVLFTTTVFMRVVGIFAMCRDYNDGYDDDGCTADWRCHYRYKYYECVQTSNFNIISAMILFWFGCRVPFEGLKISSFGQPGSDDTDWVARAFTVVTVVHWFCDKGSFAKYAKKVNTVQMSRLYFAYEVAVGVMPLVLVILVATAFDGVDAITLLALIDVIIQVTLKCYQLMS